MFTKLIIFLSQMGFFKVNNSSINIFKSKLNIWTLHKLTDKNVDYLLEKYEK